MCEHACHEHEAEKNEKLKYIKIFISIILLVIAFIKHSPILYICAYLISGYDVLFSAIKNILKRDFFDENFLMAVATIGAICIKEYPEAVCVMLLYEIGEFLQDKAVKKSKKSISELITIMPDRVNIERDGRITEDKPQNVLLGDIIVVKPGEKIAVDGEVIAGAAYIDTSSITGESILKKIGTGEKVISGCINTNGMLKIKAEKTYKDSTVYKIIELIEHAAHKKSKTENFITKFAKIYTPIVVLFAVLIAFLPLFTGGEYIVWLKRSLTFLVISCPCAFVISVPLTFFAGIGRASKSGILIKGSSYIEQLSKVSDIAFDKTGTITQGCFKVIKVKPAENISENKLLEYAAYCEFYSNHPIANAIKQEYKGNINFQRISDYKEQLGLGIEICLNGSRIKAGNEKFITNTKGEACDIHIEKDGEYIGSITISDVIKNSSKSAIQELTKKGIRTTILTGDTEINAKETAKETGIQQYFAELLPQNKVEVLENIMSKAKGTTVFVGDGINDAPVITRSDVGIAMGNLGSDSTIEAADIVIADDNLEKIPLAIEISQKTITIAKQNIAFAITIKIIFLLLGSTGFMTMWGAVFADVGVTLIAVLNSLRTLKIK